MISLLIVTALGLDFYFNLGKKTREAINYLVVGGLTTVVSIVTYCLFREFIDSYLYCTILSWIVAVVFAYIANRKYVFFSKEKNIFKEFVQFILSRLLSLGFEVAIMFLLVDLLLISDKISKILVQFVVIVLNYIFSKVFVFKSKRV